MPNGSTNYFPEIATGPSDLRNDKVRTTAQATNRVIARRATWAARERCRRQRKRLQRLGRHLRLHKQSAGQMLSANPEISRHLFAVKCRMVPQSTSLRLPQPFGLRNDNVRQVPQSTAAMPRRGLTRIPARRRVEIDARQFPVRARAARDGSGPPGP